MHTLAHTTHTVLHAYQLAPREHAVSITSCSMGGDMRNTYFVVGTAFVDPTQKEPTKGRILVFQVTESELK